MRPIAIGLLMTILTASGKVITANGVILTTAPVSAPAGFTDPANWTRYASNPIINVGAGGQWDANWIHPYTVLKLDDNTYRMYYGGSASGGESGVPDKIGIASSNDGYSWTKYGSNPIFEPGAAGQWDDTAVEHFTVVKEGSNWYAWYAGDPGGRAWSIGYATSADGISWTKYGSNPVISPGAGGQWDSAFIVPSCVLKEGSTYYMFYWGGNNTGDMTTWKIGLATSTDRTTWTKSGSNPVFSGAAGQWDVGVLDVHILLLAGVYYMFYQGNLSDGTLSAMGIATSADKVNWSRVATNPFSRGAGGTWDDAWNEGPFIINIGEVYFMYYMGYDDSTNMKIGLMTFTP